MAIVVLGMHRSGTSCVAGMLAAARVASAGHAIRNWDNARGHHEMLALVRLNEAVLAHSGAHYLAAPREVMWSAEHAGERDRLLATTIDGVPPLLKDPRTLLVLPFWRASAIGFRAIGVMRHPLAVARSLASWRELPLGDGVAQWLDHNRALAADRAAHNTPVIDFDRPRELVVDALAAWSGADAAELATGYDEQLVHHDAGDPPEVPQLADALALYTRLGGQAAAELPRRRFPRAELERFETALRAGDLATALARATAAIERAGDPVFGPASTTTDSAAATRAIAGDLAAVLVPITTALIRRHAYADALALLDRAPGEPALHALLRAKISIAAGDPIAALPDLEAACAVEAPLYQARALLPHALRAAGRHADARVALEVLATDALYPHGPLSTLAEWSFLDGDRIAALGTMARAIEAAPLHRRGRLRCRCAEWLRAAGELGAARRQLERAIEEDPAYERATELLSSLAPA